MNPANQSLLLLRLKLMTIPRTFLLLSLLCTEPSSLGERPQLFSRVSQAMGLIPDCVSHSAQVLYPYLMMVSHLAWDYTVVK